MDWKWRVVVSAVLFASLGLGTRTQTVTAAGVVGTGTAGSCNEAALDAALSGGGLVTFNCGGAPHTIGLTSEKVISVDTEIDGGGLITLDGQTQTRIFVVDDVALELRNLTLTRGSATGTVPESYGGAIYVDSGLLTIINSTLSDNTAASEGGAIRMNDNTTLSLVGSTLVGNAGNNDGGALFNDFGVTATIVESVFDSNSTVPSSGARGGAIYNRGDVTLMVTSSMFLNNEAGFQGGAMGTSDSIVNITHSTLSGNVSRSNGGAIHDSGDGTVEISNSVINSNQASESSSDGGGIYSTGDALTITNSTVRDNFAGDDGGGIYSTSVLTVIGSTLDGNQSGSSGGGLHHSAETLTVTNSTLSNNTVVLFPSSDTTLGDGGGILINRGAAATVTNSTLSGNAAHSGGGIYNAGADLTLLNSTITGNALLADVRGPGTGAGIRTFDSFDPSSVELSNTVIANNSSGDNCDATFGSIISAGGNLSDDDSCNLTEPSDLPDTAADLGPLADNGGATETHLPRDDSPALDNAVGANCPEADQRGISRPQGSGCDIGAVERVQGATYTLCASYYTGAVTSPRSGGCGTGTLEITPFNTTFCIDLYTGKLLYQFGRACNPPRVAHTLPDDGDLLTCVSLYTGANRWVSNHSQCSSYEVPNTIPATP